MIHRPIFEPIAALRDFLRSETAGGFALMASGALALIVANSPLATVYFGTSASYVAGRFQEDAKNHGSSAESLGGFRLG
jgi:Na+/H+ antiporter NhaA